MREIFTVTTPLNLHADPRPTARRVDQLSPGDQIEIDGHKGNWLGGTVIRTRSGLGVGEVGWVDGAYGDLKTIPDTPSPQPHEIEPEIVKSQTWVWLLAVIVAAATAFVAYGVLWTKP
jgi:hypothetical protein